jgi:type I restriction enzyme S subunit
LNELPAGWRRGNIRRFATMKTGHTPSRSVPEYWEETTIPWFTLSDVWQLRDGRQVYLGETTNQISELGLENSAAELLPAGTVVLSRTASVGFSGVMPVPMATSQDFWNWVCGPELLPEYLNYQFKALAPRLRGLNMGSTHQTIYQKDAAGIEILVPPTGEQGAIVDYLDHETAQIDELIGEQNRLIGMLRERRLAVIDSELGKHGLRPSGDLANAEGSEIPSGWQLIKLSQVLEQLTNGYVGPTRDILADKGVRYVQGMHIKAGRIDFDRRHFFVSREWHEARPRIHLREGDVLIVQTGDIGRVAVVPPDFGEASCHALQIARVRHSVLSGEYLAVYLSSWFGYNSLLYRATGALHPHLEGGIRAVPVVVPPLEVQDQILSNVHRQTDQIDTLIAETERLVELARERRTALIAAAVTGELDVRSVA